MRKRTNREIGERKGQIEGRSGDYKRPRRKKVIIEEYSDSEQEIVEIEPSDWKKSHKESKEEKRPHSADRRVSRSDKRPAKKGTKSRVNSNRHRSSSPEERKEEEEEEKEEEEEEEKEEKEEKEKKEEKGEERKQKEGKEEKRETFRLVRGNIYKLRYKDKENEWKHGYVQITHTNKIKGKIQAAWLYQKSDIIDVWAKESGYAPSTIREWLTDVAGMSDNDYCYSNHCGKFEPKFFLECVSDPHFPVYFVVDVEECRITPVVQSAKHEAARLDHADLFIETDETLSFISLVGISSIRSAPTVASRSSSPLGEEESKNEKGRDEEEREEDREEEESVGTAVMEPMRSSTGGAELSLELRQFRDSLCADERVYFETTEGVRVMNVLRPMLTFGNSGRASQVMNELVHRFYFGNDPNPRLNVRTVVVNEDIERERGRCGLCDLSPRVLSAQVRFPGLDDIQYHIGSECMKKLTHANTLLEAVCNARRWFLSTDRRAGRAYYTQLEQHYKTVTQLCYPSFARPPAL